MAFIEDNPDTATATATATGARFTPTAPGYYEVLTPVREACASNLSELAIFSTTGG
ncbi:hypothetical protein [Agromyces sp. Root81]|uniref:hypothetical protein n=1 Tax=Agromyces sp. Root81 TaxID=1736601 RepID=UPI000A505F66|nr:hypothetical protein [Agromyces sp. Root81]